MRILLIDPPLVPTGEITPPVGLCTLAAWVLKHGHNVRILDLSLRMRQINDHSRDQMFRLITRALAEYHPQIVGITSMYNNSYFAELIIQHVKRELPSVYTVAGGPHFGANPLRALARSPSLDAIVEGEGEAALVALAESLAGRIPINAVPNLYYRRAGITLCNAKGKLLALEEYSFNIWEVCIANGVFSFSDYCEFSPSAGLRAIYIEAGRGCPFACEFCAPAQFWDRKYRIKPADTIVSEIAFLYKEVGYDYFLLVHDLLTANRAKTGELAKAIVNANLPIQWMGNSRIDIDLNAIYPVLRDSGCRKFFFGVESASVGIQRKINKHLDPAEAAGRLAELSEYGIGATCSFVVGFPGESRVELSDTLGYGARLALVGAETVQFHRLRLFPPAPMATSVKEKSFDLETLQLEYPFNDPLHTEIDAIAADADFFSGYFAPASTAGTAQQLSQVELVFQQMVSLAPFSLTALYQLASDELVATFYAWLEEYGPVSRESIDWHTITRRQGWLQISPIMSWMASRHRHKTLQYTVFTAARHYDESRIFFLEDWREASAESPPDSGKCVDSQIDVRKALEAFKSGNRADIEMLNPTTTIFMRSTTGEVVALQGGA